MMRKLTIPTLAILALCLLSADAKAGEFHCSVEPCTYTPKTTEPFTFFFFNEESTIVSCKQMTGEATAAKKTTTELTVTNLKFQECKYKLKTAIVRTNGCDLLFNASGALAIQGCESGKSIEFELEATSCLITLGSQSISEGVTPFTSGGGESKELGLEVGVEPLSATADPSCGFSEPNLATVVTGVAVFTGESNAGVMASAWHDPEFHCSVEPCRLTAKPDGEPGSETATQRIRIAGSIANAEFLCSGVTGEATAAKKTVAELTVTNVEYQGCVNGGFPIAVRMNGCDYLFNAAGTLTITCPAEKKIEIEGPFSILGVCKFTVAAQGPIKGVAYHRVGLSREQVTVENRASGISATNDSSCPVAPAVLSFVTSNFILTGETDPGGVMARAWFQ